MTLTALTLYTVQYTVTTRDTWPTLIFTCYQAYTPSTSVHHLNEHPYYVTTAMVSLFIC